MELFYLVLGNCEGPGPVPVPFEPGLAAVFILITPELLLYWSMKLHVVK